MAKRWAIRAAAISAASVIPTTGPRATSRAAGTPVSPKQAIDVGVHALALSREHLLEHAERAPHLVDVALDGGDAARGRAAHDLGARPTPRCARPPTTASVIAAVVFGLSDHDPSLLTRRPPRGLGPAPRRAGRGMPGAPIATRAAAAPARAASTAPAPRTSAAANAPQNASPAPCCRSAAPGRRAPRPPRRRCRRPAPGDPRSARLITTVCGPRSRNIRIARSRSSVPATATASTSLGRKTSLAADDRAPGRLVAGEAVLLEVEVDHGRAVRPQPGRALDCARRLIAGHEDPVGGQHLGGDVGRSDGHRVEVILAVHELPLSAIAVLA